MYHSAIATRGQILRRNQNTARWRGLKHGLGPISNAVFVALIVAIVGMMYLTQITRSTSFGYRVDELQAVKTKLLTENAALENEAARLQALERVESSSVARGLQAAGSVEFVD